MRSSVLVLAAVALAGGVMVSVPALAADNEGGTNTPPATSPRRPPPVTSGPGGGVGGSSPGGGGYDDQDESHVPGCGAYTPVSSAYVETIHPSSSTDGSGTETRPYIEADDWAAYRANPGGTWFACSTGTRDWYDYIAGAMQAIDFADRLAPPTVTFEPPGDKAVVTVDTWIAIGDYANVRIDEDVAYYDWEARPVAIVWSPGDGSDERRCPIPPGSRPPPGSVPSEADGCRHRYLAPSVGEPDSAYEATVAVEYEIYVRLAPAGAFTLAAGDNPILGQEATAAVSVGELQAVADTPR